VSTFEVRSLVAIEADTPVTICYLSALARCLPRDQRQALLRRSYRFTCGCLRCQRVEPQLEGVNCKCPKCPSTLAYCPDEEGQAYICSECKARVCLDKDVDTALSTLFTELKQLSSQTDEVGQLKDLLERCVSTFPRTHWLAHSIYQRLSRAAIDSARQLREHASEEVADPKDTTSVHDIASRQLDLLLTHLDSLLGVLACQLVCFPATDYELSNTHERLAEGYQAMEMLCSDVPSLDQRTTLERVYQLTPDRQTAQPQQLLAYLKQEFEHQTALTAGIRAITGWH
jgi:hypothetical protein